MLRRSWSRSTRARPPTSRPAPGASSSRATPRRRASGRARPRGHGAARLSVAAPASDARRGAFRSRLGDTPATSRRTTRATLRRYADSGWRDGVAPVGRADVSRGPAPSARSRASRRARGPRPLRIAPSIVAGQPVSRPGAGANDARAAGRRARPAGGRAGTAGERRRRLAAHPRPAGARPGRGARSARRRSARRARGPRVAASSGAPLDDDRQVLPALGRDARSARPRSKTQCAGLPSSAASGGPRIWPVEEEMDAHDRRVLEAGIRLPEQARALRRRQGDHDHVGLHPLAVGEHDRAVLERRDARRRVRITAPCCAQRRARRVAVHLAERGEREDEVARLPLAEQGRLHGEERRARRSPPRCGRLSAGPDEDVPEAVDRRLRLAEPAQERARSVSPSCVAGSSRPSRRATRATPSRSRDGQVPVAQERRSAPAPSSATLPSSSITGSCSGSRRTEPACPIRARKREVLRAAAERDVLAVVGRRRRVALALGQRLHRAAERRPRLEEGHLVAGVGEVERRGEPGQAAADDHGPHAASRAGRDRSRAACRPPRGSAAARRRRSARRSSGRAAPRRSRRTSARKARCAGRAAASSPRPSASAAPAPASPGAP